MMLKSSFWTSRKENLKRRIWPLALFGLFLLFVYPVRIAMILSTQIADGKLLITVQKDAFSYVGFDVASVISLTLGAVICGLQGFQWLYNRKKVDMYGSQPVSLANRYRIVYGNGILIYFIPHIIAKLLSIVVIALMGGFSGIMLLHFGICLLAELIYYLAIYHVTLVAVMLCGHGVIAILATGVLLFYEPLVRSLLVEYKSYFYYTYTYRGGEERFFFSPVMQGINMISENYNIWEIHGFALSDIAKVIWLGILPHVLYLLVFGAVFGLLAYLCFKKRPMEACEVAIAFPVVKAPVKIAICFLAGLVGGIAFHGLSNHNIIFTILGLLSGLVIAQFVMEIIYQFDIRGLFHGMKSFAVAFVLTAGVFSVFWLDLFGYDKYIPKAEDIASAGIKIEFDNSYNKNYVDEKFDATWMDNYDLENMEIQDVSTILTLAEAGMGRDRVKRIREEKDNDSYHSKALLCTVRYNLKNGKSVDRNFYIDYEQQEDTLNALFADKAYKKGSDIILQENMTELFDICEATYYNGTIDSKIPNDRVAELMKNYQLDYQDMTFSEIKKDIPYGTIRLSYKIDNIRNTLDYPVYTTYKRTTADLLDCGAILEMVIRPEAVGNITITNYNCADANLAYVSSEDMVYYENSESEYPDYIVHTYDEPEQIEKILEGVYSMEMTNYCYIYNEAVVPGVDLELKSSNNELANQYNWYDVYVQFRAGCAPEFVRNDMGIGEGR